MLTLHASRSFHDIDTPRLYLPGHEQGNEGDKIGGFVHVYRKDGNFCYIIWNLLVEVVFVFLFLLIIDFSFLCAIVCCLSAFLRGVL